MRIAVVSCTAYSDAWNPFFELWKKFWPDCPYQVSLVTDEAKPGTPWCTVVSEFAAAQRETILLLQEDFFLTGPVHAYLVRHALYEMKSQNAAMVRLYPCPGSNEDYGDSHFGRISKGTDYRVSCQASIWNPVILSHITSRLLTPSDFEIDGSRISNEFDQPFLAFKRDVQPWPMEYLCSAISRGKWNPGAVALCRQYGISIDTSMRDLA